MQPSFFPAFVSAAGVYAVGEIFDGNPSTVCPYQSSVPGVLNYPLYFALTSAFGSTSGSMSGLASTIDTLKTACADTTLLAPFLENHDNPRFASVTPDVAAAQNAIGLAFLVDGIPILYQGQEQHFSGGGVPANREALWLSGYDTQAPLYGHVATLNALRNHAIASDPGYTGWQAEVIYTDTTTIALRKGSDGLQLVGVWSNKGSGGAAYGQGIPGTGFEEGTALVEVLGCEEVTAGANGTVQVAMGQGAPKVFYAEENMAGSGLCGY